MSDWWVKYEGHIGSVSVKYPEYDFLDIKSQHGVSLATYRFHNPRPRGLVFILHGMHLASSDATHIARRFFDSGFTVLSYDQEGHGRSAGQKGTVVNVDDYCKDCENFILKVKAMYPAGLPIFLLGHSMGGLISVMLSLKRPDLVTGMLLFAPALGIDPNFQPSVRKIVKCFYFCCKGLGLSPIDQNTVSRNPFYPGYFNENPDFYAGKINVRTYVAMINSLENIQLQFESVKTPYIVFQGGNDKVTNSDIVKEFLTRTETKDKELVFYDEMYHTIFHEPEINEILNKCIEWTHARVNLN